MDIQADYLSEANIELVANKVISDFCRDNPGMEGKYSVAGWEKCRQDIIYHLQHLSAALTCKQLRLFSDYAQWCAALFIALKLPPAHILQTMNYLRDSVSWLIKEQNGDPHEAVRYIESGIAEMKDVFAHASADIEVLELDDCKASVYLDLVLSGSRDAANSFIEEQLDKGAQIKDIYLEIFQPAQYLIGEGWQQGKITVAQEHYATAVTQTIMAGLYPKLFSGRKKRTKGVLVAACAPGELHEIGMRMVTDLLEMEGWDTYYLGANLPEAGIEQELIRRGAGLLCLSATILPHVPSLERIIKNAKNMPNLSGLKIMVGGRPFNIVPELWQQIGADGCAPDAIAAMQKAKEFIA